MTELYWKANPVNINIYTRTIAILCVILTRFFAPTDVHAIDVPFLERTVTVQIRNERMDIALKRIASQGGFIFSYNPMIINTERVVTETFVNKSIREVLDQLFAGGIQYKERGKYVILTRADGTQKDKTVGGYIMDEAGERLKNVTVYDPVSLSSAVTDSYGYFELQLDEPLDNVTLVVNKQNYSDTLLVVPRDDLRLLRITIKESSVKIATLADSVGKKIKRFWTTKVLIQDINLMNVTDTLYRKTQFSFLPFIGTNHKLSGNVINDYSFNLLSGFSMGNRIFELGGLANFNRGNVHGGQIAGLFNVVVGDVNAGQFAGLGNLVSGSATGAQFAGFANLVRGSATGVQFSGLANITWNGSRSFAAAGLVNLTRGESVNVKFAGLANVILGKQKGFHGAGLANFALKETSGLQLAGLANFSGGNSTGAQVAGLANFNLREVKGVQLSALFNFARRVKGVQIGLVNVADSVKGVQFGLLSFAWKGYHTFEASADEVFYANLAFRTGTRKFYNIFAVGLKPNTLDEEQTMWSFGYGVGTMPKLNRGLSLNADLTANQVVKGNIEAINLLNKMYLGLDIRLAKKLSLTFGATLNASVTDNTYEHYPELFSDYTPTIFHTSTQEDITWRWWWGAKAGIRFL